MKTKHFFAEMGEGSDKDLNVLSFPSAPLRVILLDDLQFGSHEVLSAKGCTFEVCCIWFPVSSRNTASEHNGQSPAEFWLCPAGPGHRFPGAIQWIRNSLRLRHHADHGPARRCAARAASGPAGQLPEDASWAVLPSSRTATISVIPQSSATSVGFKTAKLIVSVQKDPLALTVTDLNGHVIVEDLPGRPIEFHGSSFRVYRKSPADEHYFGLGDKPGPLDRRNEAFVDWNSDAYGWQESTDPIYKSIPYFRTYRRGIAAATFLDNTWRAGFDFNKEYRDGYSFGSEGGPLDYYILYGPDPKAVVRNLGLARRHHPAASTLWTLGFQQSRYSYFPEAEVRRIATRLRSERIPVDVIWLDIDFPAQEPPLPPSIPSASPTSTR